MDFKKLMNTSEYDFLRTNERLGNRIMLLGLGGSYAYGTNNEGSDVDFRGVTLMMPSDLLGLTEFEQYEDDSTDTVMLCIFIFFLRLHQFFDHFFMTPDFTSAFGNCFMFSLRGRRSTSYIHFE